MKILITGSEGLLMQTIIPKLLKQGHSLVGVDNLYRHGEVSELANKEYPLHKIDLADRSKTKDLCNIVRKYRNVGPNGQPRMESYIKKPTLNELHVHLFKRSPKGLHDALIDVRVCLRCFLKVVYHIDYVFSTSKLALEK